LEAPGLEKKKKKSDSRDGKGLKVPVKGGDRDEPPFLPEVVVGRNQIGKKPRRGEAFFHGGGGG